MKTEFYEDLGYKVEYFYRGVRLTFYAYKILSFNFSDPGLSKIEDSSCCMGYLMPDEELNIEYHSEQFKSLSEVIKFYLLLKHIYSYSQKQILKAF